MLSRIRALLIVLSAASLTMAAHAQGILRVTSPANGAFVGNSTVINFTVEMATFEVTVTAQITRTGGGASTTLQTRVTPDPTNHNATGTLTWNPSQSFPEGSYDITVSAMETGNTYTPVMLTVTLDRIAPRLIEFSPINNSFINGPITITARIDEPNIDNWRVTVNDADLPDNTSSTSNVSVLWDPSNIEVDGPQTVKIIVKDLARNESTQTISVRLDRAPPNLVVNFPQQNTAIRPASIVTVLVDVVDSTGDSVDPLAIKVEIRNLSGVVLRRVSRLRYDNVNSTTARWVGRWRAILPPGNQNFKLVVSGVDRAGNVAVTQEVLLHFGR